MISQEVTYYQGDTRLLGYMAYIDDAKAKPVVLIAHAWGGRDRFVKEKAEYLARLGYVGFAIDMYGDARCGSSVEENTALMTPLVENRALLQDRILAAYNTVKQSPLFNTDKIAAIGFCFGGLCVLDLLRSGAEVKGVVSFHGLLHKPELPPKPMRGKALILHGHDDPMVPPSQVLACQTELTEANVNWQCHIYGHTTHAFTNPQANDPHFGTVYSRLADKRAHQAMENFLVELFT